MDGFSQSEQNQLIRSHFLQDSKCTFVWINGLSVQLHIEISMPGQNCAII